MVTLNDNTSVPWYCYITTLILFLYYETLTIHINQYIIHSFILHFRSKLQTICQMHWYRVKYLMQKLRNHLNIRLTWADVCLNVYDNTTTVTRAHTLSYQELVCVSFSHDESCLLLCLILWTLLVVVDVLCCKCCSLCAALMHLNQTFHNWQNITSYLKDLQFYLIYASQMKVCKQQKVPLLNTVSLGKQR